MSLWASLCAVYPKLESDDKNKDLKDINRFLLKDGLLVINASIEISLNKNAEVLDIVSIPKELQKTVFPVAPDSIARTVGIAPNPLFENLGYMAGDWNLIENDNDELKKYSEKHTKYLELLKKWADFTNFEQIKIIYKFLSNTRLLQELFNSLLLKDILGGSDEEDKEDENENSSLTSSNKFEENLKTFKSESKIKKLAGVFVRFKIFVDNSRPEVYFNQNILEEWSHNYKQIIGIKTVEDIDYITGEKQILKLYSPKKLRHQGDEGKLISSNDQTIRTFGGRFDNAIPNQAVTLGHNSMTKALYSLSWLISNNHAFSYDGLVVLAYSVKYIDEENLYNVLGFRKDKEYLTDVTSNDIIVSLARYGQRSKSIDNYTGEHKVNVLMLDGEKRISICYYNELDSSIYYKNLENWVKTMCWTWWNFDTKKMQLKTPTFDMIFGLIYKESREDKKLKKQFYKWILPCVIDNKPLPRIFAKKAFEKVKNPQSFDSNSEWLKNIFVACAVINKYYEKEGLKRFMALDKEETNRSYLFGRLIAMAEQVEKRAIDNNVVQTNAERLFTRFTMRPGQTFNTLHKLLMPYFDKLYSNGKAGLATYFKNEIAEILSKISKEDFASNKAVDEMFILGYYGQRYYKKEENLEEGEE